MFDRLHLHNESLRSKGSVDNEDSCADGEDVEIEPGGQVYIDQFGFPVATCCGYLPQDNTWTSDWPVGIVFDSELFEKDFVFSIFMIGFGCSEQ
jgi:hypothetical protein